MKIKGIAMPSLKGLTLFSLSLLATAAFASNFDCQKTGAKISLDKSMLVIEQTNVP